MRLPFAFHFLGLAAQAQKLSLHPINLGEVSRMRLLPYVALPSRRVEARRFLAIWLAAEMDERCKILLLQGSRSCPARRREPL